MLTMSSCRIVRLSLLLPVHLKRDIEDCVRPVFMHLLQLLSGLLWTETSLSLQSWYRGRSVSAPMTASGYVSLVVEVLELQIMTTSGMSQSP